jgi:hypothetical protein
MRDFVPAYDGFGSFSSEAIGAGGPVYVGSTSDRVEIFCTTVKDAKCHNRT